MFFARHKTETIKSSRAPAYDVNQRCVGIQCVVFRESLKSFMPGFGEAGLPKHRKRVWALLVNNLSLYFCFLYVNPFSTRNARLRSRLIATCHWLLPLSFLHSSLVSGDQPSHLSLLSSQFHCSKKTRMWLMTSDGDYKSTSVYVTLISFNFHLKDLKFLSFFFQTQTEAWWMLYKPTMFFLFWLDIILDPVSFSVSPVPVSLSSSFLVYVSLLFSF